MVFFSELNALIRETANNKGDIAAAVGMEAEPKMLTCFWKIFHRMY